MQANSVADPSATPRELVRKLSADIAAALNTPEFKTRPNEQGLEPVGNTPEEFDVFIRTENGASAADHGARKSKHSSVRAGRFPPVQK